MEGKLFVINHDYTIGSPDGPQITEGKPLEIQLGGYWITGHIERGGNRVEQLVDTDEDTVEEASEESFPASDPPAWSRTKAPVGELKVQTPSTTSASSAYCFIADADGNVCGLYPGMRVRTH